jgi:hypothetical protein
LNKVRQDGDDKIPSNIRQPVPGFKVPDHRGATGCGPAGELCAGPALLASGQTDPPGHPEGKRAEYGEEIVPTVSAQLVHEFGESFSKRNLFRMIRFAEVFPTEQIVATLSTQLGWSHFVEIVPLKNELQRDFYAEMCRIERWSIRTLRQKISGMLFERTALSKKPVELAKQELIKLREEDKLTPDLVFRDPYFLDFLGLKDTYSEKDLETAICMLGVRSILLS